MKTLLALSLIVSLSIVVHASENSVEVTLEDTPEHQHARQTPWMFRPRPANRDSDAQYGQWRYKFYAGSDRPLARESERAAIKRLLPSSMPVTIRWISRSLVVVAADCYSDSDWSGRVRCLYVLEKHGSKWKITHHYSHWISTV